MLHRAISINETIGCGDVAVLPGDIILGDKEGVMVNPAHLAEEAADECVPMILFKDLVMENVQDRGTIIGFYPLTNESIAALFEAWKKRKRY